MRVKIQYFQDRDTGIVQRGQGVHVYDSYDAFYS
jgi:hypothetical protein